MLDDTHLRQQPLRYGKKLLKNCEQLHMLYKNVLEELHIYKDDCARIFFLDLLLELNTELLGGIKYFYW